MAREIRIKEEELFNALKRRPEEKVMKFYKNKYIIYILFGDNNVKL
jgi:hypothetical protein